MRRLYILEPSHTQTGKLVGVISERDLRLAADSPFLGEPVGKAIENLHKHKVSDVMAKAVVSVDETDTIVDAAKLLRVSHIDGAPVVSSAGQVIGMISRTGAADGSSAISRFRRFARSPYPCPGAAVRQQRQTIRVESFVYKGQSKLLLQKPGG